MPGTKISNFPDGGAILTTDQFVVARAGVNRSILGDQVISGYPTGHLFGLTLSNNAVDPTNDIDIAVGNCRDDLDSIDMALASALTKRLDAAWAVGSGNGGLDAGAIANTTYHVFLIKRSDTGVVDALFSTSPTAPTLPANYDYQRRIGSIIRSAAAILKFWQDGDDFIWDVPINNVNQTNPGTAAVTAQLSTPNGIRTKAIISIRMTGNTAAGDNPQGVLITDLQQTNTAPSSTVFTTYSYVNTIGSNGSVVRVYTNTSSQIRYRVAVSTANTVIAITTAGWVDTRGRLA